MNAPRRGVMVAASAFAMQVLALRQLRAEPGTPVAANVPWQEIAAAARDFVSGESPATVWPFDKAATGALRGSARKVLIHYFPFFQLSFDNAEPAHDHWAQFVNPHGVGGRFATIGGYTRERPLTPPRRNGPYWRQFNAAVDVLRASMIGADGFGVDIPRLGAAHRVDQLRILCDAAAAVAPGFSIALEPGMAALGDVQAADLADELAYLGSGPAINRLADGRILVISFAAEKKPVAFWTEVADRLRRAGKKIALVPDFLDLAGQSEAFRPISYGETFWGPRDPAQAKASALLAAESRISKGVTVWMQPIAPQDVRPKSSNFWEAGNTELFRTLWMQAIQGPARYAHIITWNDYGESTEVQPSTGTQFLFYDLLAYYTEWFKLGRAPAIRHDAIYYCHRTEIYQAREQPSPGQKPFTLMGSTPIENNVEMVALLTAPAEIEIEQNGKSTRQPAPAGLAVLKAPAQPGRPVFRVHRGGAIITQKVSDWMISEHLTVANPMYFGGSSTRPFVRVSGTS